MQQTMAKKGELQLTTHGTPNENACRRNKANESREDPKSRVLKEFALVDGTDVLKLLTKKSQHELN